MLSNEDFQVELVPPQLWYSLVEEAFSRLTEKEQRFAQSVLTTMHNRHIGITPDLVAELVPVLLDPTKLPRGTWNAVFKRLIDELALGLEYEDARKSELQTGGFGLLLGSNPVYSVLRLVMPIIENVCRQPRVGKCYLFCPDEVGTTVWAKDTYVNYSDALSREILELANNKDNGTFDLFWKERAATLSSFSRQPHTLNKSSMTLPEIDPTAFGLLLRLEPEMPVSETRSQQLKYSPTLLKYHQYRRQKEGGIEGIRVTREEDDFDNILLSEFLNHEIVLNDRLLNTGYLATQRQPKHKKLRDILITALMPRPEQVWPDLNADFIKACWFDCMMRLGFMLRQHHLFQSEFRWVEGDVLNRFRSQSFLLQEMPVFAVPFESRPNKAFRHEFLKALRWLPSYLDSRDHFHVIPNPVVDPFIDVSTNQTNDDHYESLLTWAYSVWKAQKDNVLWINHDRSQLSHRRINTDIKVDRFTYIHVMLFLPTKESDVEQEYAKSTLLGRLNGRLGLGNSPGRNASITWVPYKVENLSKWAFSTRGPRSSSLLFDYMPPDPDHRELAGRLEQIWLDQFIREIRGA